MRTNYKDYRGLPTDIKITELDKEYDLRSTKLQPGASWTGPYALTCNQAPFARR